MRGHSGGLPEDGWRDVGLLEDEVEVLSKDYGDEVFGGFCWKDLHSICESTGI